MTGRLLAIDGALARSAYPERPDRASHAGDRWARSMADVVRRRFAAPVRREIAAIAGRQRAEADALAALSDESLRQRLRTTAAKAVHDTDRGAMHDALLLLAEAARRTLGLRPYPVQLVGAATLLSGRLAEMQTGEGKTLTAGLAACLAAVAGVPVHVITVNDYLAERDAATLSPLFGFFSLTVGVVVNGVDPAAKRAAYRCSVTYCTNKELVFDYLRDRVAMRGRASALQQRARALVDGGRAGTATLLRGLHFAIVDEADSILVDEARTPLILAEKAGEVAHADAFAPALALAAQLRRDDHFAIDVSRRELHLTHAGRDHVAAICAPLAAAAPDSPWRAAHVRDHLLLQALRALHLYRRDEHYLVDDDGRVQIIDEYTGRVLPGRNWEQGLHQMIECKEGVALSEQTRTLARITYQRFFARYLRLSGMTGTASELSRELAAVYRLGTVVLPPHRPNARRRRPERLCADEASKWEAVADLVAERHAAGQPVLIGTRSVEASERLGAVLTARRLPHRVLNARQDAEEAAIVAAGGRRGAITVATNMAGRGTDIALDDGVAAVGGLFVVLTEYHESPRIDRQLVGRGARQGDPGVATAVVAADDLLFVQHGGALRRLLTMALSLPAPLQRAALIAVRRAAQAGAERLHARTRRDTLKRDHDLDRMMGFSGDAL